MINKKVKEKASEFFSRKRNIRYTLIALILLSAIAAGFAWHIVKVHYIRHEVKMAQGALNVVIYDDEGNPVHGVDSNEIPDENNVDHVNTATTVLSNFDNSLRYEKDHMTFYAKVKTTVHSILTYIFRYFSTVLHITTILLHI